MIELTDEDIKELNSWDKELDYLGYVLVDSRRYNDFQRRLGESTNVEQLKEKLLKLLPKKEYNKVAKAYYWDVKPKKKDLK